MADRDDIYQRREAVRLRVRKFRIKHAGRLRVEGLYRVTGPRTPKPAMHAVVEWVDSTGTPARVFVCRLPAPDPPAGLVRSTRWVPGAPLPRTLARMVRDARVGQVCGWAGCTVTRRGWFRP